MEWDLECPKRKRRKGNNTSEPSIRLHILSGRIAFSKKMASLIPTKDGDSVNLLFSRSKNAIVFEFSDKKDFFPNKIHCYGGNYCMFSLYFFQESSINEKFSGRYIPKLENIPNVGQRWVIYLGRENDGVSE